MAKDKELEQAQEKAEAKVGTSALAVYFLDKFGSESYARTYSVADHGEAFKELAEEFKAKKEAEGKTVVIKKA